MSYLEFYLQTTYHSCLQWDRPDPPYILCSMSSTSYPTWRAISYILKSKDSPPVASALSTFLAAAADYFRHGCRLRPTHRHHQHHHHQHQHHHQHHHQHQHHFRRDELLNVAVSCSDKRSRKLNCADVSGDHRLQPLTRLKKKNSELLVAFRFWICVKMNPRTYECSVPRQYRGFYPLSDIKFSPSKINIDRATLSVMFGLIFHGNHLFGSSQNNSTSHVPKPQHLLPASPLVVRLWPWLVEPSGRGPPPVTNQPMRREDTA